MKNNNLKYLIAGTGGVGGSIAAFLALAGKDVTCIARGGHLAALHENGLKLHSDLKGEHTLDVPAYTAEEYAALASSADAYKADVIFVCVKGYSVDSITELIRHAAHKDTVVIPILNVYGTGPRIQRLVPGVTVLDGCIYIVGFVSGKGEITQMGKIFRLVYGAHKDTIVSRETLAAIQQDLQESGIKADISPDINRDTFVNGLSSRPWPLPEPTTTCLWAKCRSPAKYATPSSGFRRKARPWDGNWASGLRKIS